MLPVGKHRDVKVVRRAFLFLSPRIVALREVVDDALRKELALEIYEAADRIPSTTSKVEFASDGLLIDGPLFANSVLIRCWRRLLPLILKPLEVEEYWRVKTFQDAARCVRGEWLACARVNLTRDIYQCANRHSEGLLAPQRGDL